MPDIIPRGSRAAAALSLVVAVLTGWLVLAETPPKRQGDAERGRKVFNGKGICYYCHGTDGYLDKRPQLNADTNRVIDSLDPKPANLRNPGSLMLKTDDERFRIIREGHLGTGMFPDNNLTDEEITDTLAYLSALRRDASPKGKPGQ